MKAVMPAKILAVVTISSLVGVLFLSCSTFPGITQFLQNNPPPLNKTQTIDTYIQNSLPSPLIIQAEDPDEINLDRLLSDTWHYLSSDWATDNNLPWSWRSDTMSSGDYANPTEIGLYALSWLAAYDTSATWSPSWTQTENTLNAILDQLRGWQTGSQIEQPHGPNAYNKSVFYQWYWITWNPPVVGANTDDNHLVPSVDNAWLAASLITIRSYADTKNHTEIASKADAILSDMDFTLWYHADLHRFSLGNIEDPQGGSLADMYSNENRIINFVASALGDLDAGEYKSSLAALSQPTGVYSGTTVESMSWDGSYFTYAAPALFIREMETSYGRRTISPATQAQIVYAQNEGYTAWGLSDCFDVGDGDYVQQGAPPAAMPGSTESVPGLVTPHASALALITPHYSQALTNLAVISNTFPSAYHSNYGFLDSVMADPDNQSYGQTSNRFSALAQEWIFLAAINTQYGFVWEYFYKDPGVINAHKEMFATHELYLPLIVR